MSKQSCPRHVSCTEVIAINVECVGTGTICQAAQPHKRKAWIKRWQLIPVGCEVHCVGLQYNAAVTEDSTARPTSSIAAQLGLLLQGQLLTTLAVHCSTIANCMVTRQLAVITNGDLRSCSAIESAAKQGLAVTNVAVG